MQRGCNGKGSRKLRDYPHNAIRAQHDADEVVGFKNNGFLPLEMTLYYNYA